MTKIKFKKFVALLALFITSNFVIAQRTYDWNEHNKAVDDIDWGESAMGWIFLIIIGGIIYLISNRNK